MENTIPAALQYRMFPVDQIKSSRSQARQDFDEPSQIDLTQSIKEEGLIQAITIRLLPDGSAELIAGERRLRAVKRLGWTEIEAKVYPAVSDQEAAIKGIIENSQRKDLTSIEEAKGFQHLAAMGLDNAEIGRRTGKNRVVISRALDLLDLPPEIQESVTRGTLTERHTRAIRKIPDKAKQIALAQQAADQGWSVKETEKRVKEVILNIGSPNSDQNGKKGPKSAIQNSKSEITPDPYASLWPGLVMNPTIGIVGSWQVAYEERKRPGAPELNMNGWSLWFLNNGRTTPHELAERLRKVANGLVGLGGNIGQPITARETRQTSSELPAGLATALPETPHLPKTPEEEAELEKLALEGPGPVFAWIYGAESPDAINMQPLSWKDLEVDDPTQGVRKIVASIRKDAREP